MMAQKRTAMFLLPGIFLFLGLSVMLFRNPAEYPVIALLFLAFIMATGFAISMETAAVFAVLVTLMDIVAIGLVPGGDKGWVAGQIIVLWVGLYLIQRFAARDRVDEQQCSDGLRERQQLLWALQKEKESLERRLGDLDSQSALRQHLSNAVHQFSSLLDPVLVRQRLMEFVRSTIGRGTIHYFAGSSPRDAMDKWVMERRLSLLVTDVAQDSRFPPQRVNSEVRAVLAAPIVVERQLVGMVRLNGFEPGLFSVGDLRVLESLSVLASLALENLQLLSRLHEGAIRDNLTGLYTHRFFQERLADEILREGRYQTEFSLLLLDVDHFKRYNDTYGHAAGDQVLVRVSQILQASVRPVDLVARYGGEEFIVILPQMPLDHARAAAEAIRQRIAAESFQFGPDAAAQEGVTVSIGISGFPHEATIASQLIRVADTRLYQAKQAGRNRVIG
jgi:diguanylate cyclase (GGDEF)-like protein